MATEQIIFLVLIISGLLLLFIGVALWALKKKCGWVVTLLGVVIVITSLLYGSENLPKKVEKNDAIEQLNFSEYYYEYKENEVRAKDTYEGNRYLITAKVRDIRNTDDSLLYWDDEIILELEIVVDNTHVVFEALFEKEQAESIKSINVDDTITFAGECQGAGAWVDCEIIK